MTARRAPRLLALGLAGAAPAAWANVPFYFVAATLKVATAWTIPVTLLVEAAVLRGLFGVGWRRALAASFVANLLSALGGAMAYLLPLALLYRIGTDGPVSGASALVLQSIALATVMVPADTLIEAMVLRIGFGLRLRGWQWAGFALANLATLSLCMAALLVDEADLHPGPLAEQRHIEAVYGPEIAWMRQVLAEWPTQVAPRAGDGRLETRREFALRVRAEAQRLRLAAFSYEGPAGSLYPVMRELEHHRWQPVTRAQRGDVIFERWEGRSDRWLDILDPRPAPRFSYRIEVERADGRWSVEALFDLDPARPAEPRPAAGR